MKSCLLVSAAVEIVLESDLVDSCKPGDRVAVVGIFRPLASASSGSTSGAYRWVPWRRTAVCCHLQGTAHLSLLTSRGVLATCYVCCLEDGLAAVMHLYCTTLKLPWMLSCKR